MHAKAPQKASFAARLIGHVTDLYETVCTDHQCAELRGVATLLAIRHN
jgi:hypothetical protein